jgi:hypothetical protein
LERHDEIEKGGAQRHDDKKNHRRSVHREHLIVLTVAEDLHVVVPQLGAYKQSFESPDKEKKEGRKTVHETDFLMIYGGEPIDYP